MSARATSRALRTAVRSCDALPTASLRAASDISTVGVVCSSMPPCAFKSRAARGEMERRLMRRLIQADPPAARQPDRGPDPPAFGGDFIAADAFRRQLRDGGANVAAHQVHVGAQERVAVLTRRCIIVDRMER